MMHSMAHPRIHDLPKTDQLERKVKLLPGMPRVQEVSAPLYRDKARQGAS